MDKWTNVLSEVKPRIIKYYIIMFLYKAFFKSRNFVRNTKSANN